MFCSCRRLEQFGKALQYRRSVAAQRRWLTAFGVLILFAKMPPEPQARLGHGQRSGSRCPTLAPGARTPEHRCSVTGRVQ